MLKFLPKPPSVTVQALPARLQAHLDQTGTARFAPLLPHRAILGGDCNAWRSVFPCRPWLAGLRAGAVNSMGCYLGQVALATEAPVMSGNMGRLSFQECQTNSYMCHSGVLKYLLGLYFCPSGAPNHGLERRPLLASIKRKLHTKVAMGPWVGSHVQGLKPSR